MSKQASLFDLLFQLFPPPPSSSVENPKLENVAMANGEADAQLLLEIQIAFAILAKAWEVAPEKLADRIPTAVAGVHAAAAKLLCTTTDLLGISGDDIFAQLQQQAIVPLDAPKSPKPSEPPESSESPETQPSDRGETLAHIEDLAHLTQRLQVMKHDRGDSPGWCVGQGPPWGGRTHDAQTCTLDCCIIVARFLNVGHVRIDVEPPVERTPTQASFFELAQVEWHGLRVVQVRNRKSEAHEMLLDELNKSGSGCAYLVQSFLPISLVFKVFFAGIPQLTFRRRRTGNCRVCDTTVSQPPEPITLISLTRNAPDLATFMETVFFGSRSGTCQSCHQPSVTTKLASSDPPARLCVETPSDVTHAGLFGKGKTTFQWCGNGDTNLRVTYEWIGGIYTYNSHFRVIWRDSNFPMEANNPVVIKTYDGLIDGGAIYGGIIATDPLNPVPDPWLASIVFLTLTGVDRVSTAPIIPGAMSVVVVG